MGGGCTRDSKGIVGSSGHCLVVCVLLIAVIVTLAAAWARVRCWGWCGRYTCCVCDDLKNSTMVRIRGELYMRGIFMKSLSAIELTRCERVCYVYWGGLESYCVTECSDVLTRSGYGIVSTVVELRRVGVPFYDRFIQGVGMPYRGMIWCGRAPFYECKIICNVMVICCSRLYDDRLDIRNFVQRWRKRTIAIITGQSRVVCVI